jgi:hypothetical protein
MTILTAIDLLIARNIMSIGIIKAEKGFTATNYEEIIINNIWLGSTEKVCRMPSDSHRNNRRQDADISKYLKSKSTKKMVCDRRCGEYAELCYREYCRSTLIQPHLCIKRRRMSRIKALVMVYTDDKCQH